VSVENRTFFNRQRWGGDIAMDCARPADDDPSAGLDIAVDAAAHDYFACDYVPGNAGVVTDADISLRNNTPGYLPIDLDSPGTV
jgi:hypothetical protein